MSASLAAWCGYPLLNFVEAYPLGTAIVCGSAVIGGVSKITKSLLSYFDDKSVDNDVDVVDDDDNDDANENNDDFDEYVASQRRYLQALRNIRGRPPIRPNVDYRNHQPHPAFLQRRELRKVGAGA